MVRAKSLKSLKMTLAVGTGLLMIPVAIIILGRHQILGAFRPEYVLGSTSLVWLMMRFPSCFSRRPWRTWRSPRATSKSSSSWQAY